MSLRCETRCRLLVLALLLALTPPVWASEPASCGEPMPDLAGSWAMIQFMPKVANLPLVGQATITAVVSLVVEIEQQSASLIMRDTYCHTEVLSSNWVLSSQVPDTVVASFDPPARTATLYETEEGWKLDQDWHLEIRGCTLAEPETEDLPVSADDPRVFDSDGDGHAGFTVPVRALGIIGGDTYVVQRLRYRTVGADVSVDRIEGPLDWSSEQIVVDASDAFLKTGFEEWNDPDPDVHRFFMVRLEEDAGCEEALSILEAALIAYDRP